MGVKLFLNRRLSIPPISVSRKLRIATFTDSKYRRVPNLFHDSKIAFPHDCSLAHLVGMAYFGGNQTVPLPAIGIVGDAAALAALGVISWRRLLAGAVLGLVGVGSLDSARDDRAGEKPM